MTDRFRYFLLLLLATLMSGTASVAQPSGPKAPGEPQLQYKESKGNSQENKRKEQRRKKKESKKDTKQKESANFRLRLVKENDKTITGVWHLPSKVNAFIQPGSLKEPREKIYIKEIVRLKVISWSEKEMAHKGEYKKFRFVPVSWQIKLRGESKSLRINKKLPIFHRLLLKQGKKRQYYYTIFYDYWPPKHNKPSWYLAKKTRFDYPRRYPLGDVVIRIDFLANIK